MAPEQQEPMEKPYELIEFVNREPKRQAGRGHNVLDANLLSGELRLRLLTRTPVQVASGTFEIIKTKQGEEIVALGSIVERYDAQRGETVKEPVIPGSSLKGALRSLVETIAPCCVVSVSRSTYREIPEGLGRCTEITRLCPACRLFGMSGAGNKNYMGEVQIEDARLIDGSQVIIRTPLLWTPARGRNGLPRRYLLGSKAKGRKIYYHSRPASGPDARIAIKQGATLTARLHFINVSQSELGVVLAALGLHPQHRFLPKIGAGKPVGLGSVEVQVEALDIFGPVEQRGRMGKQPTTYQGAELAVRADGWMQTAQRQGLLSEKALVALAGVLGEGNLKRPPVEGMY